MATPKKKPASISAETIPPKRVSVTLPVTLTTERRATAGAELASLNKEYRDLADEKARVAKGFKKRLGLIEARKIPLGEALKAADERARDGVKEPLTVQLETDCEARPIAGAPYRYDVYRLDTPTPTFVHQVYLPPAPTQESIPGVDAAAAAPADEQALFEEGLRAALEGVAFPEDDAPSGGDGEGDDSEEEDPLG